MTLQMALKRDFSQMLMNARRSELTFSKLRIFLAKALHAALLRTQINPSTMADPQMYEISSVSSTKGCSKQIRDLICLLGVGFSLCKVVFALGQAKFCVLATFIRIARLFGHFSQGNWLLSLFSYVVFKRMQKICEISPWLVAFERTCSYQFSLWETFKKKQIIHTGILDFWFLAAQFPQSIPATANGSQT